MIDLLVVGIVAGCLIGIIRQSVAYGIGRERIRQFRREHQV